MYMQVDRTNNNLKNEIHNLSISIHNENMGIHQSINVLAADMDTLKIKYKQLNSSLEKTQDNLSKLDKTITTLESEFGQFEKKYINLTVAYNKKSEDYSTLRQDMAALDSKIKEKMIWFTQNTKLTAQAKTEMSSVLNKIENYCVKDNKINLPCTIVFLSNNGYTYIPDAKDHIESINEFAKNGGGDCEDWVMFIRAFLNNYKNKNLVLMKKSKGSKFDLYKKGNTKWYLPDMESQYVPTNNENYLGVCYSLTNGGHCVVSVGDGDFIQNGDIVFEPQTGEFLGEISKSPGNPLYYFKNENKHVLYQVAVIIGEKDINVWDNTKQTWLNYKMLDTKISKLIN